MSGRWVGSRRKQALPRGWPRLRRRVLERDGHACTWRENGVRCGALATEVDHITPGHNHGMGNLRALCRAHHAVKSSREGVAALARRAALRRRPPEHHPGMHNMRSSE